jgi:hypothetical protein
MGGPVPQETRRRRNVPAIPATVVEASEAVSAGPELPNPGRYSERTRAWYETWRTCEQAPLFSRTAWLTLHMLADLVDAYFEAPSAEKWSQIKQTQTGLLALPADQRRANFRVELPKPDAQTPEGRRTDPRSRLKAVADAS